MVHPKSLDCAERLRKRLIYSNPIRVVTWEGGFVGASPTPPFITHLGSLYRRGRRFNSVYFTALVYYKVPVCLNHRRSRHSTVYYRRGCVCSSLRVRFVGDFRPKELLWGGEVSLPRQSNGNAFVVVILWRSRTAGYTMTIVQTSRRQTVERAFLAAPNHHSRAF
jgi:hypothetical protein